MVAKLRMGKNGDMIYSNEQLNKTVYSSQKEQWGYLYIFEWSDDYNVNERFR